MQHTKLKRLVRALKIRQFAAVGVLESLWHLTARETPEGNIGRLTNEDIATWIDWDDSPDELIEALVTSGWLDEDSTHRLLVHDWMEHADDATKLAIKRKSERVSGIVPQKATVSDKTPLPEPVPEPEPKPVPRTKAATADKSALFVLPAWIDRTAWDGFDEMRKKKRTGLTDHGKELCVKKLEALKRAGHDPTEVLNQSTMQGWQGLFEVKGGSNGTNHGIPAETRAERNVREAIELMDREEAEARSGGNGVSSPPC